MNLERGAQCKYKATERVGPNASLD